MSWGITANVYVPRARKATLMSEIEENEHLLEYYKRRLLALASDNAISVMHEDGYHVPKFEYLAQEIPQMVEGITETAGRLALLQALTMSDNMEEE